MACNLDRDLVSLVLRYPEELDQAWPLLDVGLALLTTSWSWPEPPAGEERRKFKRRLPRSLYEELQNTAAIAEKPLNAVVVAALQKAQRSAWGRPTPELPECAEQG